jgi:hypothetical protein
MPFVRSTAILDNEYSVMRAFFRRRTCVHEGDRRVETEVGEDNNEEVSQGKNEANKPIRHRSGFVCLLIELKAKGGGGGLVCKSKFMQRRP